MGKLDKFSMFKSGKKKKSYSVDSGDQLNGSRSTPGQSHG